MELNIELLKWQKDILDLLPKYRFFVLAIGRQAGKTYLCIFIILLQAFIKNESINWWVAPIFTNSKIAFRRMRQLLSKNKIPFKANISELRIDLPNGSSIEFKSADKEEGLRGESVDFMAIDEMGLIKRDSWEYALRGTITATKAKVLFMGTPKGKNLFYELFCKGQDKEQTEYISIQLESRVSKFFGEKEWIEVQKLPQRVFEQEYQAKFIDDGGEVFRGVRACIKGSFQRKMNKVYFAGVDLAKSFDFTVICILDNEGHLVAFDRFNDISWAIQKRRIVDLCNSYDAYTMIDSTGIGDPILEDLQPNIRAEGFKFSNTTKRQLIENLAIGVERQEISFPEIPELINELNIFTFTQTEGGLIKYNAPEGMHDDIVIALALAFWAYKGGKSCVDLIQAEDGRETWDF